MRDPRERRRAILEVVGAPLAMVAVYFVVPLDAELWPLAILVGFAAAVLLVPLTVRRVRSIRVSDRPVLDAIGALGLTASLVIISFATSYYTLGTSTDQLPGIETKIDALYFTVVTLATVGYGDITPVGQGARALVTVQILLNVTLIATSFRLLARVASERHAEQGH